MSAPAAEVSNRLLTAWRGEILAGAVYKLIARRLEPREAEIMRKMADAESGHRRRLEDRKRTGSVSRSQPCAPGSTSVSPPATSTTATARGWLRRCATRSPSCTTDSIST
ncbi:MAG: ferritin family protein, partial [Solirubrobacteraceae bacterium]